MRGPNYEPRQRRVTFFSNLISPLYRRSYLPFLLEVVQWDYPMRCFDGVEKVQVNEFLSRWGANLNLLPEPADSPTHYSLSCAGSSSPTEGATIDALRIRFIGRWGNYVIALSQLFYLADLMAIKQIYIVRTSVMPLPHTMRINNLSISSTEEPPKNVGYSLEGQFFFPSSLGELLSDLTPNLRYHIARTYIRPLMAVVQPTEDYDLLIHVRSGDIFEGRDGLGGTGLGGALYTQPPLSFYEMAADAALQGKPGQILILSENSLNPTIFPLVCYLESIGHAVVLRLNHDFNQDLGLLLNAKKVAFAAGTIGVAIAMLSSKLQDAYFFRHNSTGTFQTMESYLPTHIRAHFAIDKGFTAVGNWQNTAEQRNLMTTFPKHQIFWEDESFRAPINIALNKIACQSSFSKYSASKESANAVNGKKKELFAFHTDDEERPWWKLDLGNLYMISSIKVYNRCEFAERASSVAVFVSDDDFSWRLVHDQADKVFGRTDDDPILIVLDGLSFRFVRIDLLKGGYLHLKQVEVWLDLSASNDDRIQAL